MGTSETPLAGKPPHGEVQENYKLCLEDRIQEQSTLPDTSWEAHPQQPHAGASGT